MEDDTYNDIQDEEEVRKSPGEMSESTKTCKSWQAELYREK
jgi:hypothetical protein